MKQVISKLGSLGNIAAILCFLHCMLFPVLLTVAPTAMIFFIPSWFHKGLIVSGVIFSLVTLCWGYRTHGSYRAFALLLASALWLGLAHEVRHPVLFSGVGAACMLAANFLNRKLCKSCEHCKEHVN